LLFIYNTSIFRSAYLDEKAWGYCKARYTSCDETIV